MDRTEGRKEKIKGIPEPQGQPRDMNGSRSCRFSSLASIHRFGAGFTCTTRLGGRPLLLLLSVGADGGIEREKRQVLRGTRLGGGGSDA